MSRESKEHVEESRGDTMNENNIQVQEQACGLVQGVFWLTCQLQTQ